MKSQLIAIFITSALCAQNNEQIDKADAKGKGGGAVDALSLRVRVTKGTPATPTLRVVFRRGGEGLGGTVTKGEFAAENGQPQIALGAWTAWKPLKDIVGNAKSWEFPSIVVTGEPTTKGKSVKPGETIIDVAVDFEFAEGGKVFKSFSEIAPKGSTVGFTFPGKALADKVTPEFIAQLNGISTHARLRREHLEKLFPGPAPALKHYAIIGHGGGYGEGPPGLRGAYGFGVRHNNPAILLDEFKTMKLLGVNGMVDSIKLADAAGVGADFRRMFWGPPGSGEPMAFFQKPGKVVEMPEGCPYDPALRPYVMERVAKAIEEHKAVGAQASWALWDDEMGVYAKDHIARCDRCAQVFREYVQKHGVTLAELGAKSWDEVRPYPCWLTEAEAKDKKKNPTGLAPAPQSAADSLRYYYSYRLMSHGNGQVYPEAAKKFTEAGIKLYAMQGPTPSWNGSSLDWHEFYDLKPNTAFVFETSNRDARIWQWESYLADIGRGICERHSMPMGCLVKPHRGAPAQRMLSVIARGAEAIEWYTYGPDYSKGDSFSQSPELLEAVAKAARFLGKAEEHLHGAKMRPAQVAFVSPRSSEIWSRATDPSLAVFENAKWVYLALRHAHVPVDVLSEQQLAEDALSRYAVLYVPGSHLRRDAAAKVSAWVKQGGTLWTDAGGLSRDEANQPSAAMNELLGLKERQIEVWGSVAQYRATSLEAMKDDKAPAGADFTWENAQLHAPIAREPLSPAGAEVLATFADGKTALTRHRAGKGEVIVAGLYSGLAYSAKVRRQDFDMRADFDPTLRGLIALAAKNITRPAMPADPLVEAVALDEGIALMNWAYQRIDADAGKGTLQALTNLRIEIPGAKTVRSIVHGPLQVTNGSVTLPRMEEIDFLVLE